MRHLTAFLVCAASAFAAGPDCDRACLKTTLDQYLSAVIKHDPSAAPLSPGFRQTENAVVVRLGTGTWKSVTGLGKMQRRYMDPASEQAAYFGILEEGAGLMIVTVRVKVERRKVAEAEWMISRKGDPGLNGFTATGAPSGNFFEPDNLIANPPSDKVLPKEARLTRDDLVAITNSYFDGITTHDGAIILAHPGCTRLENGNTMTGRPIQGSDTKSDCASGLANINVQNVAARRYPVVDEETGVVLAMAVFLRKPGTTPRRNVFSEWFVIENGKIRNIYSAMFFPTGEVPVPNWPPYDGNWPLSPTLAPAPAPATPPL